LPQAESEDLCPFITIQVTEHIRSRVYRGQLAFGGIDFQGIPDEFAGTVVIKNADSEEEINKLAYELTVNLGLRNAGVTAIPRVIGFFLYTSMPGQVAQPSAALVMEDGGKPLGDSDVISRVHMYVSILFPSLCNY
jgi:hypothetical protein